VHTDVLMIELNGIQGTKKSMDTKVVPNKEPLLCFAHFLALSCLRAWNGSNTPSRRNSRGSRDSRGH